MAFVISKTHSCTHPLHITSLIDGNHVNYPCNMCEYIDGDAVLKCLIYATLAMCIILNILY